MSGNQPSIRTEMERVAKSLITAARNASHYFEKLERTSLHASAYYRHTDWLLGEFDPSPPQEAFLHPFPTLSSNQYIDLILGFRVKNENSTPLKFPTLTQIHHIIRELTIGIYIFQQTPQLSFIPNHDGSTTVRITPAYNNTLIGQTMISIGYAVISLLNRFEFDIDKQSGLGDNWRTLFKQSQAPIQMSNRRDSLQVANAMSEQIQKTYFKMGMIHLPKEPTYIDGNTRMREERNDLLEAGLLDLDKLQLPNRNDPPDFATSEEAARKQTFLLHIDSLIPHIVGRLKSVNFNVS
ncbi:Ankyrin and armadillo repeat-containing protein [Oopsacas minuta]|uniref:Ankyrin and armadillo repeat-containing protein n=1 Tax=Oopsacas minuta TaxID=111878 RepID=A0AAV7JTV4_9METZ|nr:Ankyrin and armadillo repeat-containing protein [Oopsacas minuta]